MGIFGQFTVVCLYLGCRISRISKRLQNTAVAGVLLGDIRGDFNTLQIRNTGAGV